MKNQVYHLLTLRTYKTSLVLLILFSSMVQAGVVRTLKPTSASIILPNSEANTFTDLGKNLISPDTENILSLSSTPGATKSQEPSKTVLLPEKIVAKSFSQMLILEYGDYDMIQDSLYSINQAKLLWDDLDVLAFEFSEEVLYTLKLDQIIEFDLNKTTNTHEINLQNINKNVYDKVRRAQKSSKKSSASYYQSEESSLLSHLFRKETLYYLLALTLIISILARAAKFILSLFP